MQENQIKQKRFGRFKSKVKFGKVSSSSNLEVVPEAIHADLEMTFRTKKEFELRIDRPQTIAQSDSDLI